MVNQVQSTFHAVLFINIFISILLTLRFSLSAVPCTLETTNTDTSLELNCSPYIQFVLETRPEHDISFLLVRVGFDDYSFWEGILT